MQNRRNFSIRQPEQNQAGQTEFCCRDFRKALKHPGLESWKNLFEPFKKLRFRRFERTQFPQGIRETAWRIVFIESLNMGADLL